MQVEIVYSGKVSREEALRELARSVVSGIRDYYSDPDHLAEFEAGKKGKEE